MLVIRILIIIIIIITITIKKEVVQEQQLIESLRNNWAAWH